MGIPVSLILIAVGAILTFAVNRTRAARSTSTSSGGS
jgi:hypothetical protein